MATLEHQLEVLHESFELSTVDELKYAFGIIIDVQKMSSAERDCIRASYRKGPLYDGDVPSKLGRDCLLEKGYMEKVVVCGAEGYNACTYKGASAYRLLEALYPGV